MAVARGYGRWWGANRASMVAALLALVMLLPVAVIFLGHWQDLDRQREFAAGERGGIEYLLTLGELTVAVVDAQSAAVHGQAVARHNLTRALEATGEVDARLGERYRVAQRWAQLREAILEQADREFDSPQSAYAAYAELSDLLLDLFTKLRETSGLIRDVDADTYYLQDGATEELPEAIVAAGRLVDLVSVTAMAAAEPAGSAPSDQAGLAAALAAVSVARVAVISPTDDLAVDLQAALDSTSSRTLSSNVLHSFDAFLREKDALLAAVPPDADPTQLDLEQLHRHRVDLQAAAIELFTVLIQEMDALVSTRIDELQRRKATAAAAAGVAVLLAVAVAAIGLIGGRRPVPAATGDIPAAHDRTRGASPGAASWPAVSRDPADVVQAEFVEWERSGAR